MKLPYVPLILIFALLLCCKQPAVAPHAPDPVLDALRAMNRTPLEPGHCYISGNRYLSSDGVLYSCYGYGSIQWWVIPGKIVTTDTSQTGITGQKVMTACYDEAGIKMETCGPDARWVGVAIAPQ